MMISVVLFLASVGQVSRFDPLTHYLSSNYSKVLFVGDKQELIAGVSKNSVDLIRRDGSYFKENFIASSEFVFADKDEVVVCNRKEGTLIGTRYNILDSESGQAFQLGDSYPLGYNAGAITLYSRSERSLKAISLSNGKTLTSQIMRGEPGGAVLFDSQRGCLVFSLQEDSAWQTHGLPNQYKFSEGQQLLAGASLDLTKFCGTYDINLESFLEIIPRNPTSQAWVAFDGNLKILPSEGKPSSAFFIDQKKRVYGYYRKDDTNIANACMWVKNKLISLDVVLNVPVDRYIIYIHDVAEDGTLLVETRNRESRSDSKLLIGKIP